MDMKRSFFLLTLLVFFGLAISASAQDQPAVVFQLKYKLDQKFGPLFFCDPDRWPVPRPEEPRAREWFAKADPSSPEFKAITTNLKLEKPVDHFLAPEILSVYREHKRLDSIDVTGEASPFSFEVRTGKMGEQGEFISGTITGSGEIKIEQKETRWNSCPKCLASGTMIDTPQGEVGVQDLKPGMPIWTIGSDGKRQAATVQKVIRVSVGKNHRVMKFHLENGRTLVVSPEHPLADGGRIGLLQVGDSIDGIRILSAERSHYTEDFTYDVLPSGPTGFYWAEGVLLGSTISR